MCARTDCCYQKRNIRETGYAYDDVSKYSVCTHNSFYFIENKRSKERESRNTHNQRFMCPPQNLSAFDNNCKFSFLFSFRGLLSFCAPAASLIFFFSVARIYFSHVNNAHTHTVYARFVLSRSHKFIFLSIMHGTTDKTKLTFFFFSYSE